MEPGVPFALLGTALLLSIAAWVGLGIAALARSGGRRRSSRGAALVLAVGAAVLAVVEVVTATQIGRAGSDLLPTARAAGLLLLASGLYAGALDRRAPDPLLPTARLPAPTPAPAAALAAGVVVPLAASPTAAALAVVAALAATFAALRARRDPLGLLLAGGLLLTAAAAALSPVADGPSGALAVVLLSPMRGGRGEATNVIRAIRSARGMRHLTSSAAPPR